MAATLATRKPIDQITAADLVDFPVWEFCLDEEGVEGMDETWVRPLAAAAVPNEGYSLSVAAEFETASGLRVNGLMGVTTAEGEVEISQAVLLFDGKYLFVPDKNMRIDADEKLRRAVVDALGPSPVFPLRYRLSVLIEGEASHREGTVA
ncbi:MAG: hypothetical protein WDN50_24300 [Bradyrhizobium sp.]